MRHTLVASLVALMVATACAPREARRFPDRLPLWREPERPFSPAPPESPDRSEPTAFAEESFFHFEKALTLEGPPRRALDVNSLDEVPDSGFFVNRIGRRALTPEELRRGPAEGPGIDLSGPLTVISAKPNGVTAGFVVQDARGDRYLIKFDPVGRYGLTTGAEAVSTRLLWALGYNVPDNRIVYFDPARLVPGTGKKAPSPEKIAAVLARAARAPDGRLRATASRFLPGKVLGPMPWHGTRAGDPNDRIPHEHRRELRALRVFFAWINNPEGKTGNTLDTYVETPGGGVVRHYLIDLNLTLGAGESDTVRVGWFHHLCRRDRRTPPSLEGLAFSPAQCDALRASRRHHEDDLLLGGLSPTIDPYGFELLTVNSAFARLAPSDAGWAARLLAALGPDELRAIAATAEWPADAEARLVDRLESRKRSILRAVFARTSSLGVPVLDGSRLCVRDEAVRGGLATAAGRALVSGSRAVPLGPDGHACIAVGTTGGGYEIVRLRLRPAPGVRPGPEMRVHLTGAAGARRIVGVERD